MTSVSMPKFASLLRRRRLAAGISQDELASRSGVSTGAISALERGVRRSPYPHTIEHLAEALGLSPQERALFEMAAERRSDNQTAKAVLASAELLGGSNRTVVFPGSAGTLRLIGREREYTWLKLMLRARLPLLLVAGEPGIGKTRLIREVASWAPKHGWQVLAGGCRRGSCNDPYAPVVDALDRHLSAQSTARRRTLLEGCAELARLLPGLADQSELSSVVTSPPQTSGQRFLFAAVKRYLANVANHSGLLLVLDDLQWAGPDALQMIAYLVSEHAGRDLVILGAYRSTDVRPGDPLATLLADLAREGLAARLQLRPLEPEDAAAMVRQVYNEFHQSTDRADALVQRVVARAGGVPFYLISYAHWLQGLSPVDGRETDGVAQFADGSLQDNHFEAAPEAAPWDVAQSIRERVAALPTVAQELLGVLAVVSDGASGVGLAALTGLADTEVLMALEAACHAGLLVGYQNQGVDNYHFAHGLIRDMIEADLSVWRRAVLRRRVSEVVAGGLPG